MKPFDYSTKESREACIPVLFELAKSARTDVDILHKTFDNYYDGIHKVMDNIKSELSPEEQRKALSENMLTDPFIHIESQIDPRVPEAEFYGRDDKVDYAKAKERQYVVRYIMECNDLESKNTNNERRLRKYGDSFAKAYYCDAMNRGKGDIKIDFINTDDIFPDPSATCIDDCEYIDYTYYLHIQKVKRVFAKEIKAAGLNIDSLPTSVRSDTQTVSDNDNTAYRDTYEIQIVEHWYKDNDGDIACSIMIGDKEIKHIAKYWKSTGSQNKNYPFIHFYRIRDERSFWNTSELKAIIPLANTADEILKLALTNMRYMANDVWTKQVRNKTEEGTVDIDEDITNEPGAVIKYAVGTERPQRAGGLNALAQFIPSIQFIQGEIQRTVRNYDSNQGRETDRVTTASGLAQLRADAAQQSNIKDSDRMQAWKRLFILLDWLALEFYDDEKMIFIGVPESGKKQDLEEGATANVNPNKGNIFFTFNSEKVREVESQQVVGTREDGSDDVVTEYYYPMVDCDVKASNGFQKSKAFTLQTLQAIMATPVDQSNYKIATMILKLLDIPQSEEIIDGWKKVFESEMRLPPEIEQYLSQMQPEQQMAAKQAFQQDPALVYQLMQSGQAVNKPQA